MTRIYAKKKAQEKANLSFCEKALLIVAVIFMITFFIMTFYWVENFDDIIFNVFIAFFFIASSVIVIVVMLLTYFCKKDFVIDFNETAYKAIKKLFWKLNKGEYYERSLEWFVMPDVWWIEL